MSDLQPPPHPGIILKENVLPKLGIGPADAAKQLYVCRTTLSRVLNGKAAISSDMAIRLEAWVDAYTAEEWLLMQAKYDLWQERQLIRPNIERVHWRTAFKKELYKVQVTKKNVEASNNHILGAKIPEYPSSILLDHTYSFNIPHEELEFPVPDNEEIKLIKIIGKQMSNGRRLNKYSIEFAAETLGIESGFLKDIENGRLLAEELPFWVVLGASRFYDVPLNYLFGETEDFDVREETMINRHVMKHFYATFVKAEKRLSRKQYILERRAESLAAEINALLMNVTEQINSFDRFKRRNPKFIDMPVGAALQNCINRVSNRTQDVYHEMTKLRRAYRPKKSEES